MSLYEKLFLNGEKKRVLVLLDPDKIGEEKLDRLIRNSNESSIVAGFLVGSSILISSDLDEFVRKVKEMTKKPVVLFPGSHSQLTPYADAVLFLSLLSGRNPQYLIDEQVRMAPLVKKMRLEPIPTAYILIDSTTATSVEFVTDTRPLPRDKKDLVIAHALAAEYMGFRLIYLEAGSGALLPVPSDIIKGVKENTSVPLVVGGGLNTPEKIQHAFSSGADFTVIGNKLEENPDFIRGLDE
ncbi:MAG TPA: geranylgeranylglyceryl/heptaprenylglyceryl phosphate synthase [Candidatus Hydrothermia bacterium]|nr:geranylgeranylglyceryl/heptaprenylglyceryl phosphate synthase [Candidatus Hydrothermae bacterium]MDD3648794.1 geranylgeranylglyceryl/heptaprenylglyceryl phosphate synthase [Candidatus Hydrothermia bacterium]MDD5572384.1 geranylgeranylglyceryl/heptaprenylglyceryl phosphate synthase [Candidatus Hydrothermia bacterium]HOK23299.1 geranylgeranylglyceryl/heptaprenylglyceryl phosphate synthase [Candidatus Hydrothermia bacterium]HOL24108.1 geranylgeranylglyceryl/heptaprenylglyceryl phosphate synthas